MVTWEWIVGAIIVVGLTLFVEHFIIPKIKERK